MPKRIAIDSLKALSNSCVDPDLQNVYPVWMSRMIAGFLTQVICLAINDGIKNTNCLPFNAYSNRTEDMLFYINIYDEFERTLYPQQK